MKKIFRFLSIAAMAALAFSACTEELNNDNINGGKTVTVHFGTENTDPSTKATLTPNEGETSFQADWENKDAISVYYLTDDLTEGTVAATWNGSSFVAELPEYTGEWDYRAAYPIPDATDNHVDFGPHRTQKGNAYNSKYDIMVGKASALNAAAGKDDSDNDIIFQMDRQTAIAYFHFTSELNEAVTSATLTVSGEGAAIASNYAYVSDFAWAPTEDCQSITITFPEEAPNAQDFQLWFNVLPTIYESMTLTVETATKTFTISRSTIGEYVTGKLYKVKKSGIKWTDKPTKIYFYESFDKTTGKGGNDGQWSGSIASNDVIYDNEGWSVTKEGGANQCLKLGSGSEKGSATTPALGIDSYSVSLWFKAAAWNASNEGTTIKLSISGSGTISPTSVSLVKGKWSEYECTITGADATTKIVFEAANKSNNRFFLDEVYVYSGPKPAGNTLYTVSMESVEGGTLSANTTSAAEGTEVTLTATPNEGYAFNNVWTVKDADEVEITVTDGKFTMPAKDVTVSGSFSKVDYTITKATCEGGSFTVTKNGVEVTKAQIDETITLTASAAEGYEFDSWSVTKETTSKSVYVNENTFTMPGANVTVKANFVELAVVPEYASLEELVKAGTPTTDGTYVTVTLTNDEITGIYTTSKGYRNGIYFKVGTQEVEIYCKDVPESWVIGGYVSGTLTNCAWKLFSSTWELCPTDWTELTYAAPCATPKITLNGTEASITCATEGATVRYTVDGTDPTETSEIYTNSVSLNEGQTIKAKAFLEGHKASDVASATYSSVEPVTYTALFGSTYNSKKVSSYSSAWSATNAKFTVNLVNWNNNNNEWNSIKAGSKNAASVATITTNAAISEAITKVVITIDAVTASSINSITLYCGDSADACTTSLGTFTIATGEQSVTISSPTSNKFYKISADCKKSSSNGTLTVSKVVYTNN